MIIGAFTYPTTNAEILRGHYRQSIEKFLALVSPNPRTLLANPLALEISAFLRVPRRNVGFLV